MPARATIEVIEGQASRVVSVPSGGLSIGRGSRSGLVLASRSVSSLHAVLYWQGDDLFLRDENSSFGTRREGRSITHPERLSDGDEVVLGGSSVLRFSIEDASFGAPLSDLSETSDSLELTEALSEAPFSIDMLPIAESLFQAASFDDLGYRVAQAVFEHFRPSRVALLEIEPGSARFRVLGAAGAVDDDATFISRTIVSEATRRGVAHYRDGLQKLPVESVVMAGASAVIAALIRPRDGRQRVVYMDSLYGIRPLSGGHAHSLQLFAAHAAAAFDALSARLAASEEQRRFERLRRYFSPAVVEQIVKGQLDVIERPQNMDVTVVFADLVGYTKLSERLREEPERVMDLLNRWLDAGARAVIAHGGTLDKFIGDTVMAVFGSPLPMEAPELMAVRCAIEMRESIGAIGRDLGENLAITVGINSGRVLAGNIGSKRRLEFTVLGDVVNVASRLQGKASPNEILAGPETAARLRDHVELSDVGEVTLKNHRAVNCFRVLGLRRHEQ